MRGKLLHGCTGCTGYFGVGRAVPSEPTRHARNPTRRAPFGFNDIEVCELSPAARQDAPRLLLALARHGFLDADQTALDGIAAIYGEVTAGA